MAKQSTKSLVIEFMDRFFDNKGKASKFFDVEDVREIIALTRLCLKEKIIWKKLFGPTSSESD